MKLLRSWMFVPGNHERRIEKARELQSDVVIYDLEDAVPLAEKDRARNMVRQVIATQGNLVSTHANQASAQRNQLFFVRINDASTPYFMEDLSQVVQLRLSGVILPKAANKEQIQLVDRLLSHFEKERSLQEGSIQIVPLIETAQGVYNAYEIAGASKRVKRLAFGSVDYTLDIGARLTKAGTEILYARSQLVVASRAAEIEPPIDAVFMDIKDADGLRQDARFARQLGFQGKLVIHPEQVAVVNQEFAPSTEEVEEAKQILSAFDEALASGSAAIQVNGKLVDYPVAERAKRIVEQARALGL